MPVLLFVSDALFARTCHGSGTDCVLGVQNNGGQLPPIPPTLPRGLPPPDPSLGGLPLPDSPLYSGGLRHPRPLKEGSGRQAQPVPRASLTGPMVGSLGLVQDLMSKEKAGHKCTQLRPTKFSIVRLYLSVSVCGVRACVCVLFVCSQVASTTSMISFCNVLAQPILGQDDDQEWDLRVQKKEEGYGAVRMHLGCVCGHFRAAEPRTR